MTTAGKKKNNSFPGFHSRHIIRLTSPTDTTDTPLTHHWHRPPPVLLMHWRVSATTTAEPLRSKMFWSDSLNSKQKLKIILPIFRKMHSGSTCWSRGSCSGFFLTWEHQRCQRACVVTSTLPYSATLDLPLGVIRGSTRGLVQHPDHLLLKLVQC